MKKRFSFMVLIEPLQVKTLNFHCIWLLNYRKINFISITAGVNLKGSLKNVHAIIFNYLLQNFILNKVHRLKVSFTTSYWDSCLFQQILELTSTIKGTLFSFNFLRLERNAIYMKNAPSENGDQLHPTQLFRWAVWYFLVSMLIRLNWICLNFHR